MGFRDSTLGVKPLSEYSSKSDTREPAKKPGVVSCRELRGSVLVDTKRTHSIFPVASEINSEKGRNRLEAFLYVVDV